MRQRNGSGWTDIRVEAEQSHKKVANENAAPNNPGLLELEAFP
jgi:hypothetical protein